MTYTAADHRRAIGEPRPCCYWGKPPHKYLFSIPAIYFRKGLSVAEEEYVTIGTINITDNQN